MVSVRDSYYDTDHEFKTDHGFMVAAGITVYNWDREPIEDPTIGVFKAYYRSWGISTDGSTRFEELPTRTCTRAELGLPEDNENEPDPNSDFSKPPKFFEAHPSSARDVNFYYKKLKCI